MRFARGKRFSISGVCCSTEEALLRKRLDAVVGPKRYTFHLVTCELVTAPEVQDETVMDALRAAGFGVRPTQSHTNEASFVQSHTTALVIVAAAALTVAGHLVEAMEGALLYSRILHGSAIALGGWRIFRRAYAAATSGSLDMNVLMSAAVVGAIAIDKWAEGAAVVVLFGLSLVLESYSMTRTRKAVQALMSSAPQSATVVRSGAEISVAPNEVSPGEILVVRPGERIPLDGVVIAGESSVNQAAITGESLPILKLPGMQVFAGSINERGSFRVEVTKAFEDTLLARIIHLVEEAHQKRAPVQMLVDRFARVYTPAVLGLAVLLALIPPFLSGGSMEDWFYRALVLLVIACPCALVISTPVTLVSAITRAARDGMLIKGGRQIEVLGKLKAIAFDKTGTLTEGKPRVTDFVPLNSIGQRRAMQLIAALGHQSEHHVASALIAEAKTQSIVYDELEVEEFESVPGLGIQGRIDGTRYYLGNHEFCENQGSCSRLVEEHLAALKREGKTGVVFGRDGEALAVIGLIDTARAESRTAIADLEALGIAHMTLLSGDHEGASATVAAEVGLKHVLAELLPEQKVHAVEELKRNYGTVAMVGDGVNDTPALAASSVGIAMGGTGTDAALETADVVLVTDDIGKVPALIGLSRKAMAIVRQNIFLALIVKGLFLILSLSGVATLWMAVLADDGAALLVILNGLRLLGYRNAE
jgi:Cd2+/Zn2+-exporting ATPase